MTVPLAPVLPEVEPLKDLPVPNNSSGMFSGVFEDLLLKRSIDATPDQVALAEKVFDIPQQPIPSGIYQVKIYPSRTDQIVEPTVAAAFISPLPAPEKELSTYHLNIIQLFAKPLITDPPPVEAPRVAISISPVVSQPSGTWNN
jgi:hypothetical protein